MPDTVPRPLLIHQTPLHSDQSPSFVLFKATLPQRLDFFGLAVDAGEKSVCRFAIAAEIYRAQQVRMDKIALQFTGLPFGSKFKSSCSSRATWRAAAASPLIFSAK